MENKKPIMIILLGPTGSGKTGLRTQALKELQISEHETPHMGVDDLVEKSQIYRDFVVPILNDMNGQEFIWKQGNGYVVDDEKIQGTLYNTIQNPDKTYLIRFRDAYWNARKGVDSHFDKVLRNHMTNKTNFTLEVTGLRGISWFINETKGIYDIYVYASVVHFEELMRRNTYRAEQDLKNLLNDINNNNVLRLPDISPDVFEGTVKNIYFNLIQKVLECFNSQERLNRECGEFEIKKLAIYDTTNSPLQKVAEISYNSSENDKIDAVKAIISSLRQRTGGDGTSRWVCIGALMLVTLSISFIPR